MESEMISYLESLGLKAAGVDRAKAILAFYRELGYQDIKSHFVSEYIDSEGKRHYEGLWFFTDTRALEAHDFLTNDRYDGMGIEGLITRWEVIRKDFDWKEASADSRLVVYFNTGTQAGTMKASGKNCEVLWKVFKAHIARNLMV